MSYCMFTTHMDVMSDMYQFSLVFLVVMGVFSDYHRGALTTAAIVLYALTAAIGGYTSAVWYKRMGGESWLRNLVITLMLYAAPFWVVVYL